ncbi:MAG: peptidyl-prolyl cis-trans isomerase [Lysobacterales bacterium]|jgi:FKBP-type peptidyl-prolyl cis-trans isomerase FkpA/FKBP-type peptidyl-prolyl cis-trans isomerase FklB|nr:MAG: peptidyl-prolyl cis-trans isomerase [Xanthomonadales bacterium]
MKASFAAAISAAILVFNPALAAEPLKSEREKVSYMIGMDVGQSLIQIKDEVDVEVMARAVGDVLAGRETALSREEANQVREAFMQRLQQEFAEKRARQAEENKKAGEAFLAENRKRKGVKVTDSGLQYEVIKEGNGKKPSATDQVKVHYVGTLIDGTKFDSSRDRGQPAVFPLNGVIPGWTEGLQLMSEGSVYKLYIPSNLAYGEQGTQGLIGPNATLIFEVELLEVVK